MPIYQYKCLDCNTIFEELISKNDQKITCLNCGNNKVKKMPSLFHGTKSAKKNSYGGCCGSCGGCGH